MFVCMYDVCVYVYGIVKGSTNNLHKKNGSVVAH